jgi:hypothetical protein
MIHKYEVRPSGLAADTWSVFHISEGNPDGSLFRTMSTASLDALTDALVAAREERALAAQPKGVQDIVRKHRKDAR